MNDIKWMINREFEYKLLRCDRKTITIQIMPDGSVIIRCPKRMRLEEVISFVERKSAWIEKHRASCNAIEPNKLTEQQIKNLREKARELVTKRIQHYAPIIGVSYGQITIRMQRTRWGSCSNNGNLKFNCLLALVPSEVLDYVVVHELCHLKELNHSKRFWSEVSNVLPDYKVQKKWLKDNGNNLIARI